MHGHDFTLKHLERGGDYYPMTYRDDGTVSVKLYSDIILTKRFRDAREAAMQLHRLLASATTPESFDQCAVAWRERKH